MVFVEPTWIEGMLVYIAMIFIPALIIGAIGGILAWKLDDSYDSNMLGLFIFFLLFIPATFGMAGVASIYWHNAYEVPSIQEKIITVKEWQPTPGSHSNGDGMMEITDAGELMVITTDGEGFFNQENFLFGKFNTRDIFNQLKVNGTYKIRYYGWREGFTSTFPNILSVEEVIDETNATENEYSDYFGIKLTS